MVKNYLLMGRTGVGKSSFINSTFGDPLAEVNPYEACTKSAERYPREGVCLIDTPGLAEEEGAGLDDAYLADVASHIRGTSIDALLYIAPLKPRFPAEEQDILRKITSHLGPEIWASSWLVFTFVASIPDHQRNELVDHRLRDYDGVLRKVAAGKSRLAGYRGFAQVLLVDNKTPHWGDRCRSIVSFLQQDPIHGKPPIRRGLEGRPCF